MEEPVELRPDRDSRGGCLYVRVSPIFCAAAQQSARDVGQYSRRSFLSLPSSLPGLKLLRLRDGRFFEKILRIPPHGANW
jgi:hypothetical protein